MVRKKSYGQVWFFWDLQVAVFEKVSIQGHILTYIG